MKAVLVMDMPEDCSECILRGFSNETDDPVCCANGFPCDYSGTPEWCPLRPLPEKRDTVSIFVARREAEENHVTVQHQAGFNLGWNACLEAIKGGEE